ncbi:MAG TPA: nucleotidyltransferase domain-containing protein [Waddliaceae bacterium]
MIRKLNKKIFTSEKDVEEILIYLSNGIKEILDKNLIGLYLFGSLTYGDFNPENSDIDLVAILDKPISHLQLDQIKQMHIEAKKLYEKWDYSKEMFLKDKTIDFIKFTIDKIKKTKLYQEMYFSS